MGSVLPLILFAACFLVASVIENDHRKKEMLILSNGLLVLCFVFNWNLYSLSVVLAFIILHYIFLRQDRYLLLAQIIPVALLFIVKVNDVIVLIGCSYLSFKMLSALEEYRAGEVDKPNLRDYLFYCLYFPTFRMGPIGKYRDHIETASPSRQNVIARLSWTSLLRVAYGFTKVTFLLPILTSYAKILAINNWELVTSPSQLLLTGFFSYIKLYISFSGMCDIAIGTSALLGVKVQENFCSPFLARNVSVFWSSWHISLTELMRRVVFYPLQMFLSRRYGRKRNIITTPIVLATLFMAIGLWHGFSYNFVLLGVYHSVGAISFFFFSTIILKHWPRYGKSIISKFLGILITQTFISLSFLLFDNSDLKIIKRVLVKLWF